MDTFGDEMTSLPIGIFGGTFDPIHFGHLRMAEELAEALTLAEVRFMPAGQPPHRIAPGTPASHRLEMARLAIAGNSRFKLDEREAQEATVSYTVDTLKALRAALGPHQPLWLLMGADAFLGLAAWKQWQQLFELAHIAVAHRPGYQLAQSDTLSDELRHELAQRQSPTAPDTPSGNIFLRPITQLDISATTIRANLQNGRSARYLIPDSVLDYIEKNGLYLPA